MAKILLDEKPVTTGTANPLKAQFSFQPREHTIRYNTLPNQPLVSFLYEIYCQNDAAASKPHTSEFWENTILTVKKDDSGKLTSFFCNGFGGYQFHIPFAKRLIEALCHLSYLIHLEIRPQLWPLIRPSLKICKAMDIPFTHDILKQTCSLALMMRSISREQRIKNSRWILIGDGFGFLGALIKEIFPDASVCFVDIGKSLFVQAVKCQQAHPDKNHILANNKLNGSEDFIYCPAEKLESLNLDFDYACSIVAIHEMEYPEIHRYFNFLRQRLKPDNLFYCLSRKKKTLTKGYITEFEKYGWSEKDAVLMDGECPWLRYMTAILPKRHWHKGLIPARFFGIPIPGLMAFGGPVDGPILHRLCRLYTGPNK